MLRRLETMVLMTGYQMPLRAIREQIASAVDLIVHTARLKDGSRKITTMTEVYGIEDDEILTQDIFVFEQTGMQDGKVIGELVPTGHRPTFMPQFARNGIELPPDEFGIPSEKDAKPISTRALKARWGGSSTADAPDASAAKIGRGRVVAAGGMLYVSSVGPIDPETDQIVERRRRRSTRASAWRTSRRCSRRPAARSTGSPGPAGRLRDAADFDTFNEEWVRWFPGDAPVGQSTLMPPLQRRAGFRVSLGVIAEA